MNRFAASSEKMRCEYSARFAVEAGHLGVRSITYNTYLIGVLLLILAFNNVDRLALGLLLQDIKVDLSLSDTQLGLMSGIAFALFYSVMGIPIARWADHGNRVTLISVTTALWSAAVVLCGMAGNFIQLLLIRMGVAVGEAGCVPAAHSLIADHFGRAERPQATSRYMLGMPLSVLIGYLLAGWINELYGWRITFMLLGLPGLLLAALSGLTLREPRQGAVASDLGSLGGRRVALPSTAHPSLMAVSATLWRKRTFRHLLLSFCVTAFFNVGITKWQPTYFVRSFHLHTGELGTWLALIYGLGGLAGTYLGGKWAVRHAARNERLQFNVMAVVYVVCGIISVFIYLAPNPYLAFAVMGLTALGMYAATGPLFATIQTLVPHRMRATAVALIYLFANLIGMGLGPLVAGALSDALRPIVGEESLRYALLSMCPGYIWGGWHLWQASRTVTGDLAIDK